MNREMEALIESYNELVRLLAELAKLTKEVDNQLPEETQSKSVNVNASDSMPQEKQD